MIKLEKCDTPEILKDKAKLWTQNLIDAINKYGSYKNIPDLEKKKLLSHYHQNEIKEPLFECSFHKCAFCECKPDRGGNIEVEHFAPKSKYPELAFEWDNFLPVCRKCNEAKHDHDTFQESIINPFKEDPEQYFEYNFLIIKPKATCPDKQKAERTIKVCDLNRSSLNIDRAELMKALTQYLKTVAHYIDLIEEADTERKRHDRVVKLRDSIENIEVHLKKDSLYSGYCKWFISTQDIYKKAKDIIKELSN